MASASAYPVQLELEAPLEVARWRPLVHWFLAIPQLVVVYIGNSVLGVLAFTPGSPSCSPAPSPRACSTSWPWPCATSGG